MKQALPLVLLSASILAGCAVSLSSGPEAQAARVRPARPSSFQIVRKDAELCNVVGSEEGWLGYEQGGITRVYTAPFPCGMSGRGFELWGNGSREIIILGPGFREIFRIKEVWPAWQEQAIF